MDSATPIWAIWMHFQFVFAMCSQKSAIFLFPVNLTDLTALMGTIFVWLIRIIFAKFEVYNYRVMTFLLPIRYVTLWPWHLIFWLTLTGCRYVITVWSLHKRTSYNYSIMSIIWLVLATPVMSIAHVQYHVTCFQRSFFACLLYNFHRTTMTITVIVHIWKFPIGDFSSKIF